jgi:hypothetical protein
MHWLCNSSAAYAVKKATAHKCKHQLWDGDILCYLRVTGDLARDDLPQERRAVGAVVHCVAHRVEEAAVVGSDGSQHDHCRAIC